LELYGSEEIHPAFRHHVADGCSPRTKREAQADDGLENGLALKVALADLDDSKENVRSALNRATRKLKRNVATAADAEFLYVWNVAE